MSKPYDYQAFEEQLEIILARDAIRGWEGFGPGHYRINGELDIWPRRRKYMYLETGEHGQYQDLTNFLTLVCV